MKTKTMLGNSEPHYDVTAKRWIGSDGRFTTERKANEEFALIEGAFSNPVHFNPHPTSDAINKTMGIAAALQEVLASEDKKPQPMPSDVYTAMLLSDYFMDTEGDLEQTITAPMEIGIKPLVVSCKDKEIEKQAREIVKQLYLDDVCQDMYYCIETYGQAYPLEDWSKGDLSAIYLLDPKLVWSDKVNSWAVADKNLISVLKSLQIPNFEYHGGGDQNSNMPQGVVGIPGELIRALYARKQAWKPYAMPPLRRSFRTLSSRQVLDEMVRATIEGYQNQLWVFKIGAPEKPATGKEILYLKAQIEGSAGDRTGHLVWNYDLEVEQHAPKGLDQILGGDKWDQYTIKLFTERGISVRMVSGNSTNNQDRNIELDVQILIERLISRRRQLEQWVSYLFEKIAVNNKWKTVPNVHFGSISLQDQMLIQQRIQPLYTTGLLSSKTALEGAGYDYETELANKKAEDRGLFSPPTTFAQTVVDKDGEQKTTKSNSGLPATQQRNDSTKESNREDTNASTIIFADDETSRKINEEWEKVKRGDVEPYIFIEWMIALMEGIGTNAYMLGLFNGEVGLRLQTSRLFNRPYLQGLLEDLQTVPISEYYKFDSRIEMYQQEGFKHGYMWGNQDAMQNLGYIGWRRILHPELSQSGPCQDCVADSFIIHKITEDWFDHPHGVCSIQSVLFYHNNPNVQTRLLEVPGIKTIRRKVY